jgi:hypothetical protein
MNADNRSVELIMALTNLAAVTIGIFLAIYLIRDLTRAAERERLGVERERVAAQELGQKVDSILAVVAAAGEGDLTREIEVQGGDAVGQMGEGLAKFFSDLRHSIGDCKYRGVEVGRVLHRDWRGHQGDHLDCTPDEPAGAECDHRSGTRGRGGQGFCGSGQRSERAGQENRQSDGRYQPQDQHDSGGHEIGGRGHWHDQRSDQ